MPVAVVIGSTPLRPRKKSKCHQERRNSPSVASFNPTSSCFLTIFSISLSSTALSAAMSISPLARLVRASFSDAVRSRLPTWSARKGGAARWDMTDTPYFGFVPAKMGTQFMFAGFSLAGTSGVLLPPHFFRQFDNHAQFRPLFIFGEYVAFLG